MTLVDFPLFIAIPGVSIANRFHLAPNMNVSGQEVT